MTSTKPTADLSREEKRARLAELLRRKADLAELSYPLSYGQQALWFLHQLAPESSAYNFAFSVRIRGAVNVGALERAFQKIVNRHSSLRTTFSLQEGKLVQQVHDHLAFTFENIDISSLQDEQILGHIVENYKVPFDLERGPVLRVSLFARSENEHLFLLTAPHIMIDVWSLIVILDELRMLYPAEAAGNHIELPQNKSQYKDYVRWQKETLDGKAGEQLWAYWQKKLSGQLPVLSLPTDRLRPAIQTFCGDTYFFVLNRDLTGKLKALARSEESTLFMTLMAALQVLLHKYSGQDDILVCSPVNGPNQTKFRDVVGYFLNSVVIRSDVSDTETFRSFLGSVRQTALEAFEHQDFPFSSLVERLHPERSINRSPVFQILFVLQNAFSRANSLDGLKAAGLDMELFQMPQQEGQTDLHLEIGEVDGELLGDLKYSTDLFERVSIERLISSFETLLSAIVSNPGCRIADLPLLDSDRRQQLILQSTNTRKEFPANRSFTDLFETKVKENPGKIAVRFGDERLTYLELSRRADQVAMAIAPFKIGPESVVPILADRGTDYLIAVLGVAKTGAAFLPLDPRQPAKRHLQILDQTRPSLIISSGTYATALEQALASGNETEPVINTVVLKLEDLIQGLHIAADSLFGSLPSNLAYVIYTSGSTGTPKGAMIEQAGMINHLFAKIDELNITAEDVVAQTASQCFDISVWQFLVSLLTGGSVEILDEEIVHDPGRLFETVDVRDVTILEVVPSFLRVMIAEIGDRGLDRPKLSRLRWLVVTGEALPADLCTQWLDLYPQIPIVNAYGPTECSDDVTHHIVSSASDVASSQVPIGHALANLQLYILDRNLEPVPVGVAAELYVGGIGVGRGYFNNPQRTAEVFNPDPFALCPGQRLYRTGDRARYLSDHTIEFLGRIDYQVKLRGYRIELGEIEAVLNRHQDVKQAIVLMCEMSGGPQLVSYIAHEPDVRPDAAGLRSFLKERLPDYMVPSSFTIIDKIPLTPNGKLDTRALPSPAPFRPAPAAGHIAPRNEIERDLAAILQELLQVENVGIHDNFFDLGGHSLLLVQAHTRLKEKYDRDLSLVDLFQRPTISALAAFLAEGDSGKTGSNKKKDLLERLRSRKNHKAQPKKGHDVAIIGMSGRFPGAKNVAQFWENLRNSVESVSFFSEEELTSPLIDKEMLGDPNYVRAGGVIEDIDLFDAPFFGFSPREAETMDPQHRLFLECAWEALEDAGYNPEKYPGSVGVFAGAGLNSYMFHLYSGNGMGKSMDPFQLGIGNDKDFLPTRVSYKLNLNGPSIAVQTSCSTSLVAVHLACQSLANSECDVAMAGGVTVRQKTGYLYQGGILSPDGHCRAFDAKAQGTIPGNGVGIVVLKRLEDALTDGDSVYAVIKGSAINNDGSLKVGYVAPGVDGQADVIVAAQVDADVYADSISYVETHGTGTAIGDPIEIEALSQAFRATTQKTGYCAIGALKTNIGHLDTAAGVAGLIKTALSLKNNLIPASLNFEEPNPQIDFASSPFYVNKELASWYSNGTPRRAAVSSFGIGGTNAHVIVEESPKIETAKSSRPWHLIPLSARTPSAMEAATANIRNFLKTHPDSDLADIAFTLQTGRKHFRFRRTLVCRDIPDAVSQLEAVDRGHVFTSAQEVSDREVSFLFSGQGSQYPGMAREIYEIEPVFRAQIDLCSELLRPDLGFDLREALYPSPSRAEEAAYRLKQTCITQPALFAVEYALAKQWERWGVIPQSMIGHSIGEFVAACIAGVFSLEDALKLVSARGRLMQQVPQGSMIVVRLGEEELQSWIVGRSLSIAAVNGKDFCVVAGPDESMAEFSQLLRDQGHKTRKLETSHAFHSTMMESAVDPFVNEVRKIRMFEPKVPYISNVTGDWIKPEEATNPEYWGKHLRGTVRFSDGLRQLMKNGGQILLEVGPGQSLTSLARLDGRHFDDITAVASLRHPGDDSSDEAHLLKSFGRIWIAGAKINWSEVYAGERRHRIALPTYPFERQRYWTSPSSQTIVGKARTLFGEKSELSDWFYLPTWRRKSIVRKRKATQASRQRRCCLIFQDDCGLGNALAEQLKQNGNEVITVNHGDRFLAIDDSVYTIDPAKKDHYLTLFEEMTANGFVPDTILHLWSVTPSDEVPVSSEGFRNAQITGYLSLINLAKVIPRSGLSQLTKLFVVTTNVQEISGEERLSASKATILGACTVIPQEYPTITCRSIDLTLASPGSEQAKVQVQALEEELNEHGPEVAVAYRNRSRWVQDFHLARLEKPSGERRLLREGGVYLITGGLGEIGLTLADHLSAAHKAKLILVGRKGLPSKEQWEEYLAAGGAGEDGVKIERIRAIESRGGEVIVFSGDVSDEAQMNNILERGEDHFGQINGVIHAASANKETLFQGIEETDEAGCEEQFRSKIYGLLTIEKLFRDKNIDFCLVMSSITSVLGGLGFSTYAATNIFLDRFARERDQASGFPWISVNWDGWQSGHVKLAKEYRDYVEMLSSLAMTSSEGVEAFDRILSSGETGQIIVSTADLQSRLDRWVSFGPRKSRKAVGSETVGRLYPRPDLPNPYIAPRNEIEEKIASTCQDVLGVEKVGIYDNFFDLGGHSLMATQLLSRLRDIFQTEIPLSRLFEVTNVAGLAELIETAQQAGSTDLGEIVRALEQIEQLSDDEVAAMLRNVQSNQPEDSL